MRAYIHSVHGKLQQDQDENFPSRMFVVLTLRRRTNGMSFVKPAGQTRHEYSVL